MKAKAGVVDTSVDANIHVPIRLHPPAESPMYMVWQHTLLSYEKALADVSSATGFVSFCAGTVIALSTALATSAMSDLVKATFIVAVIAFVMLGAWFVLQLRRAQVERDRCRPSAVALAAPAAAPPIGTVIAPGASP